MNLNVWRRVLAGMAVAGFGILGVVMASQDAQAQPLNLDQLRTRPPEPPQRVQRKSVEQLMAILRTHKGGPQAIAVASRGGARLSPPKPGGQLPLASAQGNFLVTLQPGQLAVGQNVVYLHNIDVRSDSTFLLNQLPPQGSRFNVTFNYPTAGWYLINVEGSVPAGKSVSAKIRPYSIYPGSTPTLQTWTYSNSAGNQAVAKSFPAVFEYKGGNSQKTLEFILESGSLEFESISAEAL